jgi:nucleoside-diphosphate-sugar epimerase
MATSILIIGSSGLIGSPLCKILKDDYEIHCNTFDLLKVVGLAGVKEYILLNRISTVVQLAWNSNSKIDYHLSLANYEWRDLTINLSIFCQNNNIKFIGVGSCLDRKNSYINPYINSKFETKKQLLSMKSTNLITWVRPFYIISLEQKRPSIIRDYFESEDKFILKNPNEKLDYIFIEDIVTGFKSVIDNQIVGEVDIGSGFLTSNLDLITRLKKFRGKSDFSMENVDHKYKPGEVASAFLRQFGWTPHVTEIFFGKKCN